VNDLDGPNTMKLHFSVFPLVAVLFAGCQHGRPKESGQFRQAELVEVVTLDPTIRLDIRYATTNNFLHRPVYAQSRAFLGREYKFYMEQTVI